MLQQENFAIPKKHRIFKKYNVAKLKRVKLFSLEYVKTTASMVMAKKKYIY